MKHMRQATMHQDQQCFPSVGRLLQADRHNQNTRAVRCKLCFTLHPFLYEVLMETLPCECLSAAIG